MWQSCWEGDIINFDNTVAFLVTLTTASRLLAVATTVVDTLMLYILPEKKRYQQAKYEEEGQEESIILQDLQPHGEMQLETGDASQDTNGDLNEPLL